MSFMASTMLSFSPKQLFRAGEKGVWYDPSDMSTLWQDSARTTAVTAVEQPVGCIDDKSGNGFNATQSTSASRPVLSARYNLLTKTEQFDDAAWSKVKATITANNTTAPDGTSTADLMLETNGTGRIGIDWAGVTTTSHTFSVALKKQNRSAASILVWSSTGQNVCVVFDLDAGTVSKTQNLGTTYSGVSSSCTDLGNQWYRCSVTTTRSSGTTYYSVDINTTNNPTLNTDGVEGYTGDPTKGIYIWGADLRVANDGVNIPAYQRVNTSTDYDTAGFRYYLRHDGTDDALATGSIDFSGTDAVTVWAGVRKLSDAARGTVVELTASAASNNGSFHLTAPNAASATYAFESKGSALTDAVASTSVAAPITSVLCAYSDISADQNILRVNGTQADSDTGDQGSGNFSNAALYIGSRGGSSLRFNGRIYGLVVLGKVASTGDITDMERWLAGRTGITL